MRGRAGDIVCAEQARRDVEVPSGVQAFACVDFSLRRGDGDACMPPAAICTYAPCGHMPAAERLCVDVSLNVTVAVAADSDEFMERLGELCGMVEVALDAAVPLEKLVPNFHSRTGTRAAARRLEASLSPRLQ